MCINKPSSVFKTTDVIAATVQDGGGFDIGAIFGSFPMLVAATLWVSDQVINKFNLVDTAAQITSWAMGLVLVLLARYVLSIGFIMDVSSVWMVIANGIGVALAANGVFDIPVIQNILGYLSLSKNKSRAKAY